MRTTTLGDELIGQTVVQVIVDDNTNLVTLVLESGGGVVLTLATNPVFFGRLSGEDS